MQGKDELLKTFYFFLFFFCVAIEGWVISFHSYNMFHKRKHFIINLSSAPPRWWNEMPNSTYKEH